MHFNRQTFETFIFFEKCRSQCNYSHLFCLAFQPRLLILESHQYISETIRLIELKLIWSLLMLSQNSYKKLLAHMTKMATTPIYMINIIYKSSPELETNAFWDAKSTIFLKKMTLSWHWSTLRKRQTCSLVFEVPLEGSGDRLIFPLHPSVRFFFRSIT